MAVIIILAVIALIATPIVLNVIENSRKESNKNSAYGILDAAKLYYTESMLDTTKTGINGKTNLLDVVSITGKAPNSGTLYISDSGLVAIAVVYDDYCFKKEFNESDLSETTTDNCTVEAMAKFGGTIDTNAYTLTINNEAVEQAGLVGVAYLDPTNLTTTCNASLVSQNVNDYGTPTGITSGCMKFYIFSEDTENDTYTMILDHNTSRNVAWNSDDVNTEMKEVATQLSTDTEGWVGNPRLIDADEIAHIVGADSTNTLKWDKTKTYHYVTLDTEYVDTNTQVSSFYLDGGRNTSKTNYYRTNGWRKQYADSTTPSIYAWLFDNLYRSTNYGGSVSDANEYPQRSGSHAVGYWTSSAVIGTNNYSWCVDESGMLGYSIPNYSNGRNGVRPVITLSKSALE